MKLPLKPELQTPESSTLVLVSPKVTNGPHEFRALGFRVKHE